MDRTLILPILLYLANKISIREKVRKEKEADEIPFLKKICKENEHYS